MSCVNYETGVVGTTYFLSDFIRFGIKKTGLHDKVYQVEPSLFPMLADWKRENTMEDILMQLKKEMMSPQNRKLSQPCDGESLKF